MSPHPNPARTARHPHRAWPLAAVALAFLGCIMDHDSPQDRPATRFDLGKLAAAPHPLSRYYDLPPGRALAGVKFAFRSMDYATEADTNIAKFAREAGREPAIAGAYFDLNSRPEHLSAFIRRVRAHGCVPFVTFDPKRWSDADVESQHGYIPALARGDFDSLLAGLADSLKAYGEPVLFRFAHEMNAGWYPYGGRYYGAGADADGDGAPDGPARYIAAWRHAHDLFRDRGAGNLIWTFCPNAKSYPEADWNLPFRYYPGGDYVDLVSADAYGDPGPGGPSLAAALAGFLNEMGLYYEGAYGSPDPDLKPFGLAEFGTAAIDSAAKAGWYAEALRLVGDDTRIAMAVQYNDRNGPQDFSIQGLGDALRPAYLHPRLLFRFL